MESKKTMIFTYKYNKIVKKYNTNTPLDLCSNAEIMNELNNAFNAVAQREDGEISLKKKIFEHVKNFLPTDVKRGSEFGISTSLSDSDGNCNVNVEISSKESNGWLRFQITASDILTI